MMHQQASIQHPECASIAAQLRAATLALMPIAKENAALEARLLAQHAWNMTAEDLLRAPHDTADAHALDALVSRRCAAEPVAQIVGQKGFWKDEFIVTRAVLTPRADSETLLETLLRLQTSPGAPLRVLDLGTGSGCLLLSALGEYPHARGVGVDQSMAALQVAQRNADRLHLRDRVQFLCSDWCSNLGDARFDVVLANPPYIPTGEIPALDADVQRYEPHRALDGGVDGLDCYRLILQQLPQHLLPGACVLFEVGMGQAQDVAALAGPEFSLHSIVPDLAGIARVVVLHFTPDSRL